MNNILENLNQKQLEAVTASERALLVIAGAGSGKTRVLVTRVAYLITEKNNRPWEIFAVTFTNKAAKEMKERLENITGLDTNRMWIGTFHALAMRILRREFQSTAYSNNFLIYDTADSRSLIKKCIAHFALDDKKYSPQLVLSKISDAKNKLITPSDLADYAASEWERNIVKLYTEYQKRLKENNSLDFDDLLFELVKLFEKHPEVLQKYQAQFKHILVDEYQDTNHAQYRIIKLLAGAEGNIFVVGDPDQSIYGWRGADIRNILDFEKDYPNAQTISLTHNYRSTQNILDAANEVIANNLDRKEKELYTDCGSGEKIVFYLAENDKDEAHYVIKSFSYLMDEGYSLGDCAILYRTHAQSRLFEEECIRYAIKYRIYGGMRFYDRMEIKNSLAYLRVVANPMDTESLNRIYNEPKRGIGKTTWDRISNISLQKGKNTFDILTDSLLEDVLGKAARERLKDLYKLVRSFQEFYRQGAQISELLQKIWQDSGYFAALSNEEDGQERLENLEQLYDVASDFDKQFEEIKEEDEDALIAFLGQLSLVTDMDSEEEENNRLTLMTLHAAKGLEFAVIFIAGMEEDVFPHKQAKLTLDDKEMEEERRLCYVGMTRAKERLILTAACKRSLWGQFNYNKTSRFIDEIPDKLINACGIKITNRNQDHTYSTNVFIAPIRKESKPMPKLSPSLVSIGDKVEHSKFGIGVIVATAGENDDMEVSVAFPNIGIKRLIWRYAAMKKI